jgi:DNA-binding CsgD family transcriptional regulator
VAFEEGKLIASLIPGARFVPLDSRNHLLLESEPEWRRWLDEVLSFLPQPPRHEPALDALTSRERDLLELIAQGCGNGQIAATLGLREKTVRNHITRILREARGRQPGAGDRAVARGGVRQEGRLKRRQPGTSVPAGAEYSRLPNRPTRDLRLTDARHGVSENSIHPLHPQWHIETEIP